MPSTQHSLPPLGEALPKQDPLKPLALLLLCLTALGSVVLWQFLSLEAAYIFKDIGSDTYTQFYPQLVQLARYIRTEGLPTWSFSNGLGQNIFPAGINNPFSLPLYLLGPQRLAWGIGFIELAKFIMAGVIFYTHLRLLRLAPYSSIAGALSFAFGGFMVLGSGWYGHSALFLYAGVMALAVDKLILCRQWQLLPVAVFLVTTVSSFHALLFSFFAIAYALFLLGYLGYSFKDYLSCALRGAAAGVLGAGLAAVFLFGDIQRIAQSPRVAGEAGYFKQLATINPFHLAGSDELLTALFRLFSNDILGTGSHFYGWYNYLEAPAFYCGLLTLLCIPLLFWHISRRQRMVTAVALGGCALVVLFPFARHAFHLFAGNYYKGSISVFVPTMLLTLGALGFDATLRQAHKATPAVLGTTLIAFIGILFTFAQSGPVTPQPTIRSMVIVFLTLEAFLLVLLSQPRLRQVSRTLLLGTMCIELAIFAHTTVNKRTLLTTAELTARSGYRDNTLEAVEYLRKTDGDFYRISKNYSSGTAEHASLNDAQIQNYYGTPAYSSTNQRYYIEFLNATEVIDGTNELQTRWNPGLEKAPLLQAFAAVKYHLAKPHAPALTLPGIIPTAHFGDVTLFTNTYALPLGCVHTRYQLRSDYLQLQGLAKHFALFKATILDTLNAELTAGLAPFVPDPKLATQDEAAFKSDIATLRERTLCISSHRQKQITGTLPAGTPGMLLLTIPYDKGWRLHIDGARHPLQRASIGFMGAMVDGGSHTIELRYHQPWFATGLLLSLLSLGTFMIFLCKPGCRGNRKN